MKYMISRCGKQIRSILKTNGKVRILSQHKPCGYYTVKINNKNIRVHNLVAEAFNPKTFTTKTKKYTIDHIDNNKLNNHVSNLRWFTRKEQSQNRRKWSRSLIDSMPIIAINIKDPTIVYNFVSMADAEEKLSASHSAVSRCINGKLKTHKGFTWSTPPSDPDIENEIWKFANETQKYKVYLSNYGRIAFEFLCGFTKKISSKSKSTKRVIDELNGYPYITIQGKNKSLHVAMWELFNGPIPPGFVVDHKNDDKQDAALSNLQIVTHSENITKAHDTGCYDGTKTARSSIKIDGIIYNSYLDAVKKLNISLSTIHGRVNNPKFSTYVKL